MGTASSSPLARLGLPTPLLPAQSRSKWLGVAALGLAAVALGAVAWRHARPRRRRRLQQVGTVAQLWIYPVKSCKGVAVNAAECTLMGLRSGHLRDRYSPAGRVASGHAGGGACMLGKKGRIFTPPVLSGLKVGPLIL